MTTVTPEEWERAQEYIGQELRARFAGRCPTPNEIKAALVEIMASRPIERIIVRPDPDRPGAVLIEGSVEMVEQLAALKETGKD